jgi:exodeoxyribonuclease V alpha subunit
METIQAVLSYLIYQKDTFVIADFSGTTALGNLSEPHAGLEYKLTGEWSDNRRYGRQFQFNLAEAIIPQDEEGIFHYLVRIGKWVGPIVARKIIELYGEKTLVILKNDPLQVAREVRGITSTRALELQASLKKRESDEAILVQLWEIFSGIEGVNKSFPEKIRQVYGPESITVVKTRPYSLMDISGIGFQSADKIALRIGIEPTSPQRIDAAIRYVLGDQIATRGNTWATIENVVWGVASLLSVPDQLVIERIIDLISRPVESGITSRGENVTLMGVDRTETAIAETVGMRIENHA